MLRPIINELEGVENGPYFFSYDVISHVTLTSGKKKNNQLLVLLMRIFPESLAEIGRELRLVALEQNLYTNKQTNIQTNKQETNKIGKIIKKQNKKKYNKQNIKNATNNENITRVQNCPKYLLKAQLFDLGHGQGRPLSQSLQLLSVFRF